MHSFPSLTIISDEISQDLDRVSAFVRNHEFDGFELRSMFGRAFRDLSEKDLAQIRERVRAEGWQIHGCASAVFKCSIDDAGAVREHYDLFRRALDVALYLECGFIRVFSFLRFDTAGRGDELTRVFGHIERLGEMAEGTGVRVCVENEASCAIATEDEVLRLVESVPGGIGIVWDPCNVLYVSGAELTEGAWRHFMPRVHHVHIKDAIRLADGSVQAMPVGLGEVGWRDRLAAIRHSGYAGKLSLETHWRRQALERELLHLPAGEAFSAGGEDASTTCLDNLRAICSTLRA